MIDTHQVISDLVQIVGPSHVISDRDALAQYSVDLKIPSAVVFPKDARQVSQVVEYAYNRELAIVPRGNGSKMSIGAPPTRLDLVVCTKRMNHLKDVDRVGEQIEIDRRKQTEVGPAALRVVRQMRVSR